MKSTTRDIKHGIGVGGANKRLSTAEGKTGKSKDGKTIKMERGEKGEL